MSDKRISRRDFLKLIGYGAIALSMGPFLNFGGIERLRHPAFFQSAFAQTAESRSLGPKIPVVTTPVGSAPPADVTRPRNVVGLTITSVSSNQLNLTWTANTELDLSHYNVYRGTSPELIVIPGITVPLRIITANLFSNTGLNPNTTYYYKIAAVDNVGNIGSLSLERSGTTNPAGTRYSTI